MKKTSEKYISLKEAGELSGYSPDYIGQLIRKGKLPGQQVYSNIAWVTTPEAVLEYMGQNKKKQTKKNPYFSLFSIANVYRFVLYTVIGISGVFSLFLFYVASVAIDAKLQSQLQKGMQIDIETIEALQTQENGINSYSLSRLN